jgi:hypothetical protein
MTSCNRVARLLVVAGAALAFPAWADTPGPVTVSLAGPVSAARASPAQSTMVLTVDKQACPDLSPLLDLCSGAAAPEVKPTVQGEREWQVTWELVRSVAFAVLGAVIIITWAVWHVRIKSLDVGLAKLALREAGTTSTAVLLRAYCQLIVGIQASAGLPAGREATAARSLADACADFLRASPNPGESI